MQDDFRIGDAGKKAADGETVTTEDGISMADNIVEVDAVGLKERPTKQGKGDGKADVFKIGGRRKVAFADLVDIKSKFGSYVGVLTLFIGDDRTVFFREFGKFYRDGLVDGLGVADGVADVVGEGADGEGELVGVMRIADEAENEISGADIVGEIAEESIAEGIIAQVLNGTAAVGVRVGFVNLRFGEGWVTFEKERTNRLFPGKIDELLVSLDRIGVARFAEEQEKEH